MSTAAWHGIWAATRSRGGHVIAGLLAGALLAGCHATTRIPETVQFETGDWKFGATPGRKITTEHYVIYTTLNDTVLIDALPQFVEGCYLHYRELIAPNRDPNDRMPVFLFATRPQWEAFTRKFTGERATTFLKVRNGGYSERGVSVIEFVANSITFPLFAHEGFHQYLYHQVNSEVPAWLNEGLAVECEGQRWGAKGLKEFDPWYNPARRNVLAQALIANKLHPLRELLRTNAGEVISGSSQSVATYYAQLWALVIFLREGEQGRHKAGFEELLTALRDPDFARQARVSYIWSESDEFNLGEALFRRYIGDDLPKIEDEYFAFMRAKFVGK